MQVNGIVYVNVEVLERLEKCRIMKEVSALE